jgi:hypothetical protein
LGHAEIDKLWCFRSWGRFLMNNHVEFELKRTERLTELEIENTRLSEAALEFSAGLRTLAAQNSKTTHAFGCQVRPLRSNAAARSQSAVVACPLLDRKRERRSRGMERAGVTTCTPVPTELEKQNAQLRAVAERLHAEIETIRRQLQTTRDRVKQRA